VNIQTDNTVLTWFTLASALEIAGVCPVHIVRLWQ
jgi:hypothetical protein